MRLTPGKRQIEFTMIAPTSLSLVVGTSADAVADLQVFGDGNEYHIDEIASAPAIDLRVTFTNIPAIQFVQVHGYYDGIGSHAIQIELYNYTAGTWDSFDAMGFTAAHQMFTVWLADDTDYISNGEVIVRLDHAISGSANHDAYIDSVLIGI